MLFSKPLKRSHKDPLTKKQTPSLPPTLQGAPAPSSPNIDYDALLRNVFTVRNGEILVGGEKLADDVRSLMRDEARFILNSELWRVLHASIINEAVDMALFQSADWDHVLSAKQLHHYAHFMRNVIHMLSK